MAVYHFIVFVLYLSLACCFWACFLRPSFAIKPRVSVMDFPFETSLRLLGNLNIPTHFIGLDIWGCDYSRNLQQFFTGCRIGYKNQECKNWKLRSFLINYFLNISGLTDEQLAQQQQYYLQQLNYYRTPTTGRATVCIFCLTNCSSKEKRPKLLNCLHSSCEECLKVNNGFVRLRERHK